MKDDSAFAIAKMKELGLTPILLTGDNERAARTVAVEVGIEDVAEVLPAQNAQVVRELQASGRVVAMGTGTDVAIEASDLTLVRNDLAALVDAIRLSRRTLGTIKANLSWAFAYDVAGDGGVLSVRRHEQSACVGSAAPPTTRRPPTSGTRNGSRCSQADLSLSEVPRLAATPLPVET